MDASLAFPPLPGRRKYNQASDPRDGRLSLLANHPTNHDGQPKPNRAFYIDALRGEATSATASRERATKESEPRVNYTRKLA